MIELLDVSYKDNIYSSLISHEIEGQKINLRFGIEPSDYGRLKRILEFRPFENTGVAPYSYFFAFSFRKKDNDLAEINVRVEQLDRYKQYEFTLSKKYISNLLWFDSGLKIKDVKALIEIKQ
ncbi:hypothetical protein DET65_3868 [Sunxiuqinia elliptica]|uniref:Uncharacterized protein n=2 Tax=Sunxiuqinia elliptica TaxID=655355 RepID=A0A4R6GUG5_9BACT|nr:hypothetical protein DET52_1074 [Sunxiuqinia elliptica]TDO56318.1 hypothetical protein DET65_3868 [Sunxiuqinia elliptica]